MEETTDGGNALEIFAKTVDGLSKIRFTGTDGVETDYGVMTLDTYAPDPKSAAGATLRSSLGA